MLTETETGEASSNTPGVILFSDGIAASLAADAAALTGVVCLPLTTNPATIVKRAGDNLTAFIIVDAAATRALILPRLLEPLIADGLRCGLMMATDRARDGDTLRKLVDNRPLIAEGDAFVLADAGQRPGLDRLAPLIRSRLPENLPSQSADLIVFSGHSGPLDARAGTDGILCARADGSGYKGRGVFSCYHDGICFRQGGRLSAIAPSTINAKVAMLAGCGTVTPGRSRFSIAQNLVTLLLLGRPRAVIASCGVTFKVAELDLLSLTWIHDGVPLGEVVRRLNAISNCEFRHGGALPPLVGPFMLFGNPALRFVPVGHAEAPSPPRVGDLPAVVTLPTACTHQAFAIAHAPGALEVTGAESCRFFFDQARATLHVWKPDDGPVTIELSANNDELRLHHRAAVYRAARNIPLWLGYLAGCVRATERLGHASDAFALALSELPEWSIWAGYASKRLSPAKSTPTSRGDARQLIATEVGPKMHRWNTRLGMSLFNAVAGHRSLPMEQWSERFDGQGAPFLDRTCSCGEAERWGQRFHDPTSRLERTMYQCSHCGPVGENDGTLQLSFAAVIAPARPGDPIGVVCAVAAPAKEHVYAAVGAVLDCRGARASMPSDLVTLEIPAGQSARIELSIPVDGDLTPGVYVVWMPGVVNGVLCVESTLVEIPPRPQLSA